MSYSYPYKVWYRRHTPYLFGNPVHQEGGSIVELLTQRLSSIHDLSYTVLHTAHGEDEYVAALDRIRQICIQTLETINEQQLLLPSIEAAADDPCPSDQPGTSTPFPEPSSSYVPSPSVEPSSSVRPPGPYGHLPSVGQYAVKDILELNEAESHMGGGYISQQQLVTPEPAVVHELPVQARGRRRVKGRGRGRGRGRVHRPEVMSPPPTTFQHPHGEGVSQAAGDTRVHLSQPTFPHGTTSADPWVNVASQFTQAETGAPGQTSDAESPTSHSHPDSDQQDIV